MKFILERLMTLDVEAWLWKLLLFVMPLGTAWIFVFGEIRGDAWALGNIALYAVDGAVLAVVAFGLLHADLPRLMRFWLVGLAVLLLGTLYVRTEQANTLWLAGVVMSLRYVLALLLFWMSATRMILPRLVFIRWWMLGAILSLGIGMWQVLSGGDVAGNVLLGIAPHVVSAPGTAVVEFAGQRLIRAYGTLMHPNILGAYGALCVFLWVKFAQEVRNVWWHWVIECFLGFGVALTFSRASLVALGAYMLTALMFRVGSKHVPTYARSSVIGVVVGVLLAGVLYLPAFAVRSGVDSGRLEVKSVTERIASVRGGIDLFLQSPMFGVGVLQSVPRLVAQHQGSHVWDAEPAHVVWLLLLAEWGLMGFVGLIGYGWIAVREVFKRLHERTWGRFVRTNVPELVGVFTLSLFDHAFLTNPQLVYIGSLALGSLVYLYATSGE